MSQTRYTWRIENYIAKGIPFVEELSEVVIGELFNQSMANGMGQGAGVMRQRTGPLNFTVGRIPHKYSQRFISYVIQGDKIRSLLLQLEFSTKTGGLLARYSLFMSDIAIENYHYMNWRGQSLLLLYCSGNIDRLNQISN